MGAMPFKAALLLLSLCLAQSVGAEDLGARWAAYAQGLAQQGRQAEAGPAFDKALSFKPGDAGILRARGQWRWSQGRRDAALEDLRASLQADPSQAALRAWLDKAAPPASPVAGEADEEALSEAQALLEGRDFEGVLALQAQPGREAAVWLRLRSEALYGLGRFAESGQALDQALAQAPGDAGLQRLGAQYHHPGLAPDSGGGPILPPLWRSLVLPGWGQAYNGQKRKAWITGALTLGLLGATLYTYSATDQALAEYRALGPTATQSQFDDAFGRADGLAVLNQAFGVAFYSAYAWNAFDAAAGARPAPAPAGAGLRLTLLALRY